MNPSRWQELNVWFSARAARERLVVLFAALVLFSYGWQLLVRDSLTAFIATETLRSTQLSQQHHGSKKGLTTRAR